MASYLLVMVAGFALAAKFKAAAALLAAALALVAGAGLALAEGDGAASAAVTGFAHAGVLEAAYFVGLIVFAAFPSRSGSGDPAMRADGVSWWRRNP